MQGRKRGMMKPELKIAASQDPPLLQCKHSGTDRQHHPIPVHVCAYMACLVCVRHTAVLLALPLISHKALFTLAPRENGGAVQIKAICGIFVLNKVLEMLWVTSPL